MNGDGSIFVGIVVM